MPKGIYDRNRNRVRTIAERFWPKVDVREPDECWPWTASRTPFGYGQISKGGKHAGMVHTHRVCWELVNGPIPEGLWVLHSCDNPPCCNPSHFFLGTHIDNMRDCAAKGRAPRGSARPNAKLSEAIVAAIKATPGSSRVEPRSASPLPKAKAA